MSRRLIQVPRMSRIPGRAPATPCACVARLGIRGPRRVTAHPRTYTYEKCPVSPAERLAPTGAVGVRPGIQGHESLVAIAEGKHAYPSRTRPLSPPAPRILGAGAPGKAGRCQASEEGEGESEAWQTPTALPFRILAARPASTACIPVLAPATPCACVVRLGIRGPSRVATHPHRYIPTVSRPSA